MNDLIALILALIAAVTQQTAAQPTETQPTPPLVQRPYIIELAPPEALPPGVDPVDPGTTVDSYGTITHPDGTTSCVTASPCDYAQANRTPGQPDIDPTWDLYETEVAGR